MDFETTKKELIQLAENWIELSDDDMEMVELTEIDASICLLEYCVANQEKIGDIDFKKLLELDDEAEDYDDNFDTRHEFISQVYYKDEAPYTDENISKNVQQLAACFFETLDKKK